MAHVGSVPFCLKENWKEMVLQNVYHLPGKKKILISVLGYDDVKVFTKIWDPVQTNSLRLAGVATPTGIALLWPGHQDNTVASLEHRPGPTLLRCVVVVTKGSDRFAIFFLSHDGVFMANTTPFCRFHDIFLVQCHKNASGSCPHLTA